MGDEETPCSMWGLKTFCLITGASKGIGQKLAQMFAPKFGGGSLMLLLARSEDGLRETERLICMDSPTVDTVAHPMDLSKQDDESYLTVIQGALESSGAAPEDFELALVVHNVGSLGDVMEAAADMWNPIKWQDYLMLNVVSVSCLNARFLEVFPHHSVKQRRVINITSLCGIKPMKSMGYYCVGKAAREMFFKVLAEENTSLKVINYSPGPVNTDMIEDIITNVGDSEVRDNFLAMRSSDSILSTEQTINRLIQVLDNDKYASGDHVDYFDEAY